MTGLGSLLCKTSYATLCHALNFTSHVLQWLQCLEQHSAVPAQPTSCNEGHSTRDAGGPSSAPCSEPWTCKTTSELSRPSPPLWWPSSWITSAACRWAGRAARPVLIAMPASHVISCSTMAHWQQLQSSSGSCAQQHSKVNLSRSKAAGCFPDQAVSMHIAPAALSRDQCLVASMPFGLCS